MNKLLSYRKEIDTLDEALIKLLNDRFDLSKKIGIYKNQNNIKVSDISREESIIKKIHNISDENCSDKIVEVYMKIFEISKNMQYSENSTE